MLLVEDEGLLRSFMAKALTDAGFDVYTAGDAPSAIASFRAHDPDALVTDQDLGPGGTGLELLASLRRQAPWIAVVVVSNYPITPTVEERVLDGVAYLRKRDVVDPSVLIDALEVVLAGQPTPDRFAIERSRLAELTPLQIDVLKLISQGLSNQEIADARGGTLRATEQLVRRIFDALGIPAERHKSSRVIAARIYFEATGLRE